MRRTSALLAALGAVAASLLAVSPAQAADYVPVSGAGSTWSENAIIDWASNVQQYGMQINYSGTGSSDGRNQFKNHTVDFAVSEIPYGVTDNGVTEPPPSRPFAYMPIVAGGTSFMYHLDAGGRQITNLRLSGKTIADIFTGNVTMWNDPEIRADNPQISLPPRQIVPVVRGDGSGTTAQLTTWMSKTYPSVWNAYCAKVGRVTPCGTTSFYPVAAGGDFIVKSLSTGVAGYVAQPTSEGSITYVEYSYAHNANFPIADMLNAAGYYTAPSAQNVAVALLKAQINPDLTQNLANVYTDPDPRVYPLSSYSYMILPTSTESPFTADKGRTLGAFAYYFLCQGQQDAGKLGFSPLPINLVQAGFNQVRRIPGVNVQSINVANCNNPTFSKNGTNTLAVHAPQPAACAKQGSTQCAPGQSLVVDDVGGGSGSGSGSGGGSGSHSGSGSGSGSGAGSGAGGAGAGAAGGTGGSGAAAGGAGAGGGVAGGSSGGVNPDTGLPFGSGAAGSGGVGTGGNGTAIAQSIEVGDGIDSSFEHVLMGLAAALLLLATIGPPLFSRFLNRRKQP